MPVHIWICPPPVLSPSRSVPSQSCFHLPTQFCPSASPVLPPSSLVPSSLLVVPPSSLVPSSSSAPAPLQFYPLQFYPQLPTGSAPVPHQFCPHPVLPQLPASPAPAPHPVSPIPSPSCPSCCSFPSAVLAFPQCQPGAVPGGGPRPNVPVQPHFWPIRLCTGKDNPLLPVALGFVFLGNSVSSGLKTAPVWVFIHPQPRAVAVLPSRGHLLCAMGLRSGQTTTETFWKWGFPSPNHSSEKESGTKELSQSNWLLKIGITALEQISAGGSPWAIGIKHN